LNCLLWCWWRWWCCWFCRWWYVCDSI